MSDFFRLLAAWLSGRYRVFPWRSFLLLVALLLYLFSPIDLIPDVIPGVGFVDDLTLFGVLVRSLVGDTRKFREWRARRAAPPAATA